MSRILVIPLVGGGKAVRVYGDAHLDLDTCERLARALTADLHTTVEIECEERDSDAG